MSKKVIKVVKVADKKATKVLKNAGLNVFQRRKVKKKVGGFFYDLGIEVAKECIMRAGGAAGRATVKGIRSACGGVKNKFSKSPADDFDEEEVEVMTEDDFDLRVQEAAAKMFEQAASNTQKEPVSDYQEVPSQQVEEPEVESPSNEKEEEKPQKPQQPQGKTQKKNGQKK